MPIDNRTTNYNLAKPNVDNLLEDDVARVRSALDDIDSQMKTNADAITTKADSSATTTALAAKADLVSGKVPSSQLPSYVDDVLEVANFAALPGTGETGKIYVTLDTNFEYRWGGSAYIRIVSSPGTTDELAEGSTNKYFTNARAIAAIPIAGASTLGGVKVGSGLSIDGAGVLSATGTAVSNTFTELSITPGSNGQTVFTPSGGYTVNQIELFLNGVLLYGGGDDYTATNGTTFTLTTGVNTTDTLLLRKWNVVAVSGMVQKTGDTLTGALNDAAAATVASAATTDIGAAASNNVTVSGSATITSLGTIAAGARRHVTFTGNAVLTQNAVSLILPGAANITTQAGDCAEFVSLGSGNWTCSSYTRASGQALVVAASGADAFNYLNGII